MPPRISEDEIDDLLYFARTGDTKDFTETADELCKRESAPLSDILVAAKDEHTGNGPLHMAAANGHTETLNTIIKVLSQPSPQNPTQLAVLNAQNTAGNTPLHWAALNGHLESVKLLIDNGADPTITNSAGHDAVYEAELNDQKDVVEWVLKESEGLEEGIGGEGSAEGEAEEDEDMGESSQENDGLQGEGIEDEALRAGLRNLGMLPEKKE